MKIKSRVIILIIVIVLLGLGYLGFRVYKSTVEKNKQKQLFIFENMDTTLTQDVLDNFKRQFDETAKYIQGHSDDYIGWAVAGNLKKAVDDFDGARDLYLEGIKNVSKENSHVLLSSLGDLYYHFIQDYVKAEEYYLQAIEIKPTNVQNYIELSILYRVEIKDQNKAINIIKKGLENNLNNKELLVHLANTYEKYSMKDESRNTWQELIKLYPDNEEYKKELANIK